MSMQNESAGRDNGDDADRGPRIVVGVDGSTGSISALRWAVEQSAVTGGSVELVYAWDPVSYWGAGTGWMILPTDLPDPQESGRQVLRETVNRALGTMPDPPTASMSQRVVSGPAAHALVQAAVGAALLVVGNRGHGPFSEAVLGSVSMRVAGHAPCPVVIVHDH